MLDVSKEDDPIGLFKYFSEELGRRKTVTASVTKPLKDALQEAADCIVSNTGNFKVLLTRVRRQQTPSTAALDISEDTIRLLSVRVRQLRKLQGKLHLLQTQEPPRVSYKEGHTEETISTDGQEEEEPHDVSEDSDI